MSLFPFEKTRRFCLVGKIQKKKSKNPKLPLSSSRGEYFFVCFFQNNNTLFFFGREERLYRRNISRCVSLYISKLFAALLFVGPLPRRIKREREKKKRVFSHTHTHTLSLGGRGGGGEGGAFVSSSFESLLLLRSVWKYLSSSPKRCCILNDHLLNHYSLRKHSSRRLPKV